MITDNAIFLAILRSVANPLDTIIGPYESCLQQ